MTQTSYDSPFPWKIHRDSRGWPRWWQRWYEAWLVVTGQYSFWHAWDSGKITGAIEEYRRIIKNGGDLAPVIDAAIYSTCREVIGCEPMAEKMQGLRRLAWERYEQDSSALASLALSSKEEK